MLLLRYISTWCISIFNSTCNRVLEDPALEVEVQGYGYEDKDKTGFIEIQGQKITEFTNKYSNLTTTPWEQTQEAVALGKDSPDR